MQKVHVVIREGVYMQGIGGVFTTKDLAKEAAKELKKLEPDDWHDFFIKSFKLNEIQDLERKR